MSGRAAPTHGLAGETRAIVLAAVCAGVVAGWLGLPLLAAALLPLGAVGLRAFGAPRKLAAGALVVAALAVFWGSARSDALDRTALRPGPVSATVTLTEAPRTAETGAGSRALAELRGEPVLVRAPPWLAQQTFASSAPGAILAVEGRLREPDRGARAQHAHATLTIESARRAGRRGGLAGALDRVRDRATAALTRGLPEREGALLTGMVLGQDAAIDPGLRTAMRDASLSHLTAASGQNVALLAALAAALGIVVGVGVRARLLLALVLICAYVPVAGAGPSIVRAAVMGTAVIVAALAGRPSARVEALLLAGAVTLVADPRAAGDLGWQLSFAAVAGIGLLAAPSAGVLLRTGLPRSIATVLAVTTAATIATAPIIAFRTGQSSLLSLPANAVVAAAVAPVMWLGFCAALAGQVAVVFASPFSRLAAVPVAFVASTGEWFGGLELATATVPPVQVAVAALLAAAAILRAGRRRSDPVPRTDARRRRVLTAVTMTVVACAALGARAATFAERAPPPVPGTLRVTGLAIGQGDATLLQAGGASVLVDTGPPGMKVVRKLRRAGVRRLDALVLTHPQLDHIGAAPEILGAIEVGTVLDGRDGSSAPVARMATAPLRRNGARIVAAGAGQRIRIGPIRADVLWPGRSGPGDGAATADPNDRAIVLSAEAYGHRVLLTADAESNVLSALPLKPVDVLKVSHHGSSDPGLPSILELLRPRVALIECGAGNEYGHPRADTLAALRAGGVARIARTDREGTVRIDLGRRLTVTGGS